MTLYGQIPLVCFLTSLSLILSVFAKKYIQCLRIPYSIFVLLAGVFFGFVYDFLDLEIFFQNSSSYYEKFSIFLSRDIIYYFILPLFVFESALKTDFFTLKKNLSSILIYLVLIVCIVFGMSSLSKNFSYWDPLCFFMFGLAIILNTPQRIDDFSYEGNLPNRLKSRLYAESVLGFLFFITLFFCVLFSSQSAAGSILSLVDYAVVFMKTIGVGIVSGYLIVRLLSYFVEKMAQDFFGEIFTLSFFLILCLFMASVLNVTAVFAALTTIGIYLGSSSHTALSSESIHFAKKSLSLINLVLSTSIFLVAGFLSVIMRKDIHAGTFVAIAAFYGVFLAARFIGIYRFKQSFNDTFMLTLGGVKSAPTLALVLYILQSSFFSEQIAKEMFLLSVGFVFLSEIVSSMGLSLILKYFYDKSSHYEKIIENQAQLVIAEKVHNKLEKLSESGQYASIYLTKEIEKIDKKIKKIKGKIVDVNKDSSQKSMNDQSLNYWFSALNVERQSYQDDYLNGVLDRKALYILDETIQRQHNNLLKGLKYELSELKIAAQSFLFLSKVFSKIFFIRKYVQMLQYQNLALKYDVVRGESQAAKKVLYMLDQMIGDSSAIDEIKNIFHEKLFIAKQTLEEIRQDFPEITHAIEKNLAKRVALNVKYYEHERMLEQGVLCEEFVTFSRDQIKNEIKILQTKKKNFPLPTMLELLNDVFLFKHFSDDQKKQLANMLHETVVSKGDMIFRENDTGSSLFIIVRGAVNVLKQTNGEQKSLGIFGGGSIFGEMALLTKEPRSASVQAVTNATIIEINQETIFKLDASFGNIMEQLWSTYNHNKFDTLLRDHPDNEEMDRRSRLDWFKNGEIETISEKSTFFPKKWASHIYLYMGALNLGDESYKSPAIIKLVKGMPLTAMQHDTKVVWLPKIR